MWMATFGVGLQLISGMRDIANDVSHGWNLRWVSNDQRHFEWRTTRHFLIKQQW
jgi:hypothetical protein